jgi:hypothetical protein
MSNDNKGDNDTLQSGEGDLALGQDERAFGAGGQQVQRPLDGNDAPDRDANRDGSLPDNAQSSSQQD